MSFLFGSRPQPSSAEKIAAAEAEIEMVSNMFNQCAPLPSHLSHTARTPAKKSQTDWAVPAQD